jgi:mono/diheme cytochrome c family protein
MTGIWKWIGIAMGGLVLLVVLIAAGLIAYGQIAYKRTHDRAVREIRAETSPEGIARGKYLLESVMGCDKACHSPAGRPYQGQSEAINFGPVQGVFTVPNLTPDEETGLGSWTEADFIKAMRNGVTPTGRLIDPEAMPWPTYGRMADDDLRSIFAYLRSLPASSAGN